MGKRCRLCRVSAPALGHNHDKKESIRPKYEELGEPKVRELLAAGRFGSPGSYNHDKASSWLKLLEDKRILAAAERAEAREEISLSISRRALEASIEANSTGSNARSDSRRANTIAIIAMILSVIIAIISNNGSEY